MVKLVQPPHDVLAARPADLVKKVSAAQVAVAAQAATDDPPPAIPIVAAEEALPVTSDAAGALPVVAAQVVPAEGPSAGYPAEGISVAGILVQELN